MGCSLKQMMNRLAYLLLGWGVVGVTYYTSSYLQNAGTVLQPSMIDHLIFFTPHAVWLYLSFFLIIPLAYFYAPYERIRWMSCSFIIISIIAGLCHLFFPTTLDYPIDTGTSLSSWLLNELIRVDSSQNCFPSLHVALTMIVVWGCIDSKHPWRTTFFILWGFGICFSIIQLRRHIFIDFIGGAVLALLTDYTLNSLKITHKFIDQNNKTHNN